MKVGLKYLVGGMLLLSPLCARAEYISNAPSRAVINWTGAYVGLNSGYAWGQRSPLDLISSRFDTRNFTVTGGFLGGTAGAQIQQGYIVIGAELDLDWANIRGSGTEVPAIEGAPTPLTLHVATKTNALGTARMRLGVAMDNWLIYGTGGAALLHESADVNTITGAPCGTAGVLIRCSASRWRPGVALGIGAEYAIPGNWSVFPGTNWSFKGEFLYVVAEGAGPSKDELGLFRVGINYKF
jgi:outer membrane immunogenic protein